MFEVGIVFRGFVLVNHVFRNLSNVSEKKQSIDDLRGAFISAISSFIETAFCDNTLEYLESGNILFIFKVGCAESQDSKQPEPIILFGLVEKTKKKSDKLVRKFMDKVDPVLQTFVMRYKDADFSELEQFEPFKETLKQYFI